MTSAETLSAGGQHELNMRHLNLRNKRIHQSRRSQAVSAVVERQRRHRGAGSDDDKRKPGEYPAWRSVLWLNVVGIA